MANTGLGRLHRVALTGERSSSIVVVEGDSAIYEYVEPPPVVATVE